MTEHKLNTSDLVQALQTFNSSRYDAVDVFADNLSESALVDAAQGIVALGGKTYRLSVFEDHGVVRLERDGVSNAKSALVGAALGGAVAAATAAASKQRGDGVLGGALLGLLVGGLLGASTTPVRRVFAMEFDPVARAWVAYDGTLLRWMKDKLLPRTGT
jgi:hypothetical protein